MARYLLTQRRHHRRTDALLMAAALAAVESGEEAINHRTLSMADYTGPSERASAIRAGTDVKPAPRWPASGPREGEALSSWLNRVALCYP